MPDDEFELEDELEGDPGDVGTASCRRDPLL